MSYKEMWGPGDILKEAKPGMKVKVSTYHAFVGRRTLTRVIRKVRRSGHIEICAFGWSNFVVRPDEVIEIFNP